MLAAVPPKDKMCHRTGFEKSCRDLCLSGSCQGRWQEYIKRNVQTDVTVQEYGCVDDLSLAINLSIEARLIGVQQAVECRGNATIKLLAEGMLRQHHQHQEAMGFVRASALPAPDVLALISDAPKANGNGHDENAQLALGFEAQAAGAH